ncbi:uncharacterized protein LOC124496488 isoform X2 [Dermatophagoides farinae]|uniref:uncharacterized protein LOC124496488 isoform X2 n=1 Tax=Dermatophagoides farinae TaxID=6954 RepID=UPI001F0E7000|nr:uncharacterized protein LOC124496488 [Dermatophagoides farinae]
MVRFVYPKMFHIINIIIVFDFSLLIIDTATGNNNNNNNIRCDRFDDMFNDFTMVSSNRRQFPTTIDEFVKYCKKNSDLANQISQSIKQCFNDSSMRNIASLVLYSYRSRTKSLCKNRNSKRAREYRDAAPCLNQYKHRLSRCIDITANKIGAIQSRPNNLKFPHLCCENLQFQRCIDKISAGDCKQKIMVFAESAQSIMNGFIDRSCGEYNADTDRCDQLEPIVTAELNKSSKPSFVRNVAELISSIE